MYLIIILEKFQKKSHNKRKEGGLNDETNLCSWNNCVAAVKYICYDTSGAENNKRK